MTGTSEASDDEEGRSATVSDSARTDLVRFVSRRVPRGAAEDVVADVLAIAGRRFDDVPLDFKAARAWVRCPPPPLAAIGPTVTTIGLAPIGGGWSRWSSPGWVAASGDPTSRIPKSRERDRVPGSRGRERRLRLTDFVSRPRRG